jgi:hypothetical protein
LRGKIGRKSGVAYGMYIDKEKHTRSEGSLRHDSFSKLYFEVPDESGHRGSDKLTFILEPRTRNLMQYQIPKVIPQAHTHHITSHHNIEIEIEIES